MQTLESPPADNSVEIALHPIVLPPLGDRPLVCVLMGNYNYAQFLPAALDSLLAQTYTNWLAIVCDDGSIDDSVRVINEFARRDSRVQLAAKRNGGQASASNHCFSLARGEIICLLDSDDLFDRRKIERVVQSFMEHPQSGVCNHFSRVIDAQGQEQPVTMNHHLDEGWLAAQALERGACVYVPTTSCISMRREIADAVFPVHPQQRIDVDGYLGMTTQFLTPFCIIRERLSDYRVHGTNMGGLTEPTPARLQYELQLINQRTANVRDFVSERFGSAIVEQISVQDNPQYIQAALKLLAIEKVNPQLPEAPVLIRRHPNAKWRAIWKCIFALPTSIRRRVLPMMHRSHRLKGAVQRLLVRPRAPLGSSIPLTSNIHP
jgi:glycosyltransferase involved in cell wall biosynthesis